MSLIYTILLWRELEEPRNESLLEIFERIEDLDWVFNIFHSIQVGRVKKMFLSMKTQTSHLFWQLKALFHQLQNFFLLSNSMWHTLSPWIAKTHFHFNIMKDILESNETCFFMILLKISSYESMFIFSVFGRIFTTRTWFWLFIMSVKFVSLRTLSTLIHIRSRNKIENFPKFTIKLLEIFHHL